MLTSHDTVRRHALDFTAIATGGIIACGLRHLGVEIDDLLDVVLLYVVLELVARDADGNWYHMLETGGLELHSRDLAARWFIVCFLSTTGIVALESELELHDTFFVLTLLVIAVWGGDRYGG